jgi:hypothetical protein
MELKLVHVHWVILGYHKIDNVVEIVPILSFLTKVHTQLQFRVLVFKIFNGLACLKINA